ncbi:MAG: GIY-YIG nuclease family protein [bacterium]|nr:GIY-YIG nuclease family protein [bacterium]
MYFTYVIENELGRKYTGSTENITERILMHNDLSPSKARLHKTTYRKGPWKLIYATNFKTRREALQFEKFLKTGTGRKWIKRARRGG